MWNIMANIILRNRFIILGIITLLTVYFAFHANSGLKIDNKYGNLLPKDNQTQKDYLEFKHLFGEDGSTLVIAIKTKDLYTEKKFLKWKELADSILKIDGVTAVICEAKLVRLDTARKTFIPHVIFTGRNHNFDTSTADGKSIEKIKKEVRNNPLYADLLYNAKEDVSLMLVNIDEKFLIDKKKQGLIIDIENLAKTYESTFKEIHFAGLPHMRVQIGRRVLSEMYTFILLSVLVSSLFMYFLFRSIRVTIISIVVVMVTVIWALGTISLMGYNVSLMMALIPPLMIVIGIPNCIYLYNKFHYEYRSHNNKAKALSRMIRKTGTAMFLTNVTTALGFMTFLYTSSEKFFEFGVISSINIMLCYVVSVSLVPIFMSLSKNPSERHLKHLDRKAAIGLLNRLVVLTSNYRPAIYAVTIVLTIVAGIGIFQMRVTGNITGDLPPKDSIRTDINFMEKNFGGSVPFEVLVYYKKRSRLDLHAIETFSKVEQVQKMFDRDTMFAKSISVVDLVKFLNMSYYDNDSTMFAYPLGNAQQKRLKKYMDRFNISASTSAFTIKDLVDTSNKIIRIRTQMKDIGSYEVTDEVGMIKARIDSIMNPERKHIESLYSIALKGNKAYCDSLIFNYPGIYNNMTTLYCKENPALESKFNEDPEFIKSFYGNKTFLPFMRSAIDKDYYDVKITGTSVVASEGTKYLLNNLWQSIIFAIISIAALMSILFYSFRMVVVSMIPNIIPMIITAGIMGWFGIPLKPSTLLIFSIALGITVDNTIHFLAHYRHELKLKKWDLKECVAISIRETGLSIIYTSVILFFGFIVFVFSDFGGTQALGYLSAITYFVALFTNLILLPSLLLSYERKLTTKSFEEPIFEIYDEGDDTNWDLLEIDANEENKEQ
jgi:predicted RND superfamily exporter protein